MATKKTVEVSVLRQRLLQFILEKKFKEYIGGDWWSKNLHPHMQDEAKNFHDNNYVTMYRIADYAGYLK